MVTSTGDVLGRWREYFSILLNSTNKSSIEKAEPLVFEVDSPITGTEVTKVGKKLHDGRTPEVDKIHPEFLKALDVVELAWLTRLCNIA